MCDEYIDQNSEKSVQYLGFASKAKMIINEVHPIEQNICTIFPHQPHSEVDYPLWQFQGNQIVVKYSQECHVFPPPVYHPIVHRKARK